MYWSFNKIAPPAPNDPLVNVTTQFNDNWDIAEAKLVQLTQNPMPSTLTDAEIGQEWIYDGRLAVWDGTNLVVPADIDTAWTSWEVLELASPVSARPLFTPRWRRNTLLKQVELSGCAIYNSAAAWPAAFTVISADSAVLGIPAAYQPYGGATFIPTATSIPSTANRAAGAHIQIDAPGGVSCQIRARYTGSSGGGNFVALDTVRWYY